MSGRPRNTFQDPALRMRHWHWLHNVMTVAKVSHASALDSEVPRHRLCRDLDCRRRFEGIALDGYDPGATTAKDHQSLLDFVAEKRGYASTRASYRHSFWKHLMERNPKESPTKSWLDAQLAEGGLLRMEATDEEHAEALGLRVDAGIWPSDDEEVWDGKACVSAADAFATLDGMLALLVLYRKALDMADDLAVDLREALARSTRSFAEKLGFKDEQLHTWEFLVGTRILRWDPSFQPSAEELGRAECALLARRSGRRRRAGQLDSGPPNARTKGRSERRWRRQIMMCAGCLPSQQVRPRGRILAISDTSAIDVWLTKNRSRIAVHVKHAVERCIEGAPGSTKSKLSPLIMPAAIYRRRRRPTNDENAWHVFGDDVPYDFIPVSVEKSSRGK